jgi:flagellar protein FlbD
VRARYRTAEGDHMIEVHHGREERPLLVNDDLIETVEATPDTVLTLTTGKKLIVRETPAEIVALIVEFRRRMQSGPRVIERD